MSTRLCWPLKSSVIRWPQIPKNFIIVTRLEIIGLQVFFHCSDPCFDKLWSDDFHSHVVAIERRDDDVPFNNADFISIPSDELHILQGRFRQPFG